MEKYIPVYCHKNNLKPGIFIPIPYNWLKDFLQRYVLLHQQQAVTLQLQFPNQKCRRFVYNGQHFMDEISHQNFSKAQFLYFVQRVKNLQMIRIYSKSLNVTINLGFKYNTTNLELYGHLTDLKI